MDCVIQPSEAEFVPNFLVNIVYYSNIMDL